MHRAPPARPALGVGALGVKRGQAGEQGEHHAQVGKLRPDHGWKACQAACCWATYSVAGDHQAGPALPVALAATGPGWMKTGALAWVTASEGAASPARPRPGVASRFAGKAETGGSVGDRLGHDAHLLVHRQRGGAAAHQPRSSGRRLAASCQAAMAARASRSGRPSMPTGLESETIARSVFRPATREFGSWSRGSTWKLGLPGRVDAPGGAPPLRPRRRRTPRDAQDASGQRCRRMSTAHGPGTIAILHKVSRDCGVSAQVRSRRRADPEAGLLHGSRRGQAEYRAMPFTPGRSASFLARARAPASFPFASLGLCLMPAAFAATLETPANGADVQDRPSDRADVVGTRTPT